ncbi:MAG: (2Fe-2S)-binding protein [Pseudomonadota bacterium]
MKYQITVNGEARSVDAEPGTPLLWVLRDELGLTGTKFGCGIASCGACTVHFNGMPIRSCSFPVDAAVNAEVTTIEGLGTRVSAAVQAAWNELDVVQCGYCQSGQIMSAVWLLASNTSPSDQEIESAMAGNVCRCATYKRIKGAIKRASSTLEA